MIANERIHIIKNVTSRSSQYVLYWMQQSQRVSYNHALQYAIRSANEKKLPVLVYFALTPYPRSNSRHYTFMLEGLKEVKSQLSDLGIQMVIEICDPIVGVVNLAQHCALMVADFGYLRIQKLWREKIFEQVNCPVVMLESDIIVPVQTTYPKEAYAAGIIRPKIKYHFPRFNTSLENIVPLKSSLHLDMGIPQLDWYDLLHQLGPDTSVAPTPCYRGGYSEAMKLLKEFIIDKLDLYEKYHNHPDKDYESHLSPYLHFGQISVLEICQTLKEYVSPGLSCFLEELVIRRDLSMNFVYYNPQYDQFDCLPNWSKNALLTRAYEPRPYLYTLEEFQKGLTHDTYWNAAQKEMVLTGKMHGYMRMYWAKKIIEWTSHPQIAWDISLGLNNKFCLDGRDPNSYAGIAWCFGKHDRAWKNNPIFGQVRTMSINSMRIKFNMKGYLDKVTEIEAMLLSSNKDELH